MVTVVRRSPDLRKQAIEQGVGAGVSNFFKARQEKVEQERFAKAFADISSAKSYEEAVQQMAGLDRRILTNPQALQVLSEQIDRKFPAQEAVQVEKDGLVQTVATRKGDVQGAINTAQQMGGRLTQDVDVEAQRTDLELKQRLANEKSIRDQERLELERRRTAASELRAQKTGMPKPSEKDKEIARLTQVLGIPIDRALRLAYDYEKVDVIPETGEVRLTDAISGQSMIMPQEILNDDPQTIPKPAEGKSLWDAARYATGPFSALRQAWSLPGNYMGVFVPEKTEQARAQLKMSTQRLIRALANNPRFAATELERIRKELALSPSVLIHPEAMRRRMVTTHQELTLWKAQMDRDANPKSGLPPDQRSAAKSSSVEIGNFLAQLNVPEEHLRATMDPQEELPANAAKFFSADEWNRLTEQERQQWLEQF